MSGPTQGLLTVLLYDKMVQASKGYGAGVVKVRHNFGTRKTPIKINFI